MSMYAHVCTCMYTYVIYISTCMCLCIYMHTHVCIYMPTHTHTHKGIAYIYPRNTLLGINTLGYTMCAAAIHLSLSFSRTWVLVSLSFWITRYSLIGHIHTSATDSSPSRSWFSHSVLCSTWSHRLRARPTELASAYMHKHRQGFTHIHAYIYR